MLPQTGREPHDFLLQSDLVLPGMDSPAVLRVSAKLVAANAAGQILVGHLRKYPGDINSWSLPGGGALSLPNGQKEAWDVALRREMGEEGFDTHNIDDILATVQPGMLPVIKEKSGIDPEGNRYDGVLKVYKFATVAFLPHEPSDEVDAARWMDIADLRTALHPDEKVIADVAGRYESWFAASAGAIMLNGNVAPVQPLTFEQMVA